MTATLAPGPAPSTPRDAVRTRLAHRLQGPARPVHPLAWWLWASAVAAAASRTTNLALLALLAVALGVVVTNRRGTASWGGAFAVFLRLALVVVAVRVVLQCLLVGGLGTTVLVTLPELPLPGWLAGIRLGGPVTAEAALAAVGDGARLAVMLLCFGAANALASPARLLRSMPRGLHATGVTLTVALAAAPNLVAAVARVRRARTLRGLPDRGLRGLLSIAVPVLEEALDRSLATAATLDARGFGRRAPQPARVVAASGALLVAGPGLLVLGLYAVLAGSSPLGPAAVGFAVVAAGALATVAAIRLAGQGVRVTRYRPDPWRTPELLTAACGLGAAIAAATVPTGIRSPDPWLLELPVLDVACLVAVVLVALPAWLTPPRGDG